MFIFGICKSQVVAGSLSYIWALDSPPSFIVSVSVPVPHSILTTTALYCNMKSSVVIHFFFLVTYCFLVGEKSCYQKGKLYLRMFGKVTWKPTYFVRYVQVFNWSYLSYAVHYVHSESHRVPN